MRWKIINTLFISENVFCYERTAPFSNDQTTTLYTYKQHTGAKFTTENFYHFYHSYIKHNLSCTARIRVVIHISDAGQKFKRWFVEIYSENLKILMIQIYATSVLGLKWFTYEKLVRIKTVSKISTLRPIQSKIVNS